MNVVTRTALLVVAGLVLAGCGLATMAQRPPEDLGSWSLVPLPPDAALAAAAIGEQGACRMSLPSNDVVAPVPQILVQDRRTQDTAAFLVVSPEQFGDCLFTRGGGSGGGFGPLLGAMEGPLTIDVRGSGTVGNGSADILGGRIAIAGTRVVVELHDGRTIVASTGNGYWLTWRPSFNGAKRVVALSPDGTELASLEVPAE